MYRRKEYSNVCAIAEICLAIGASNSTGERGFSKLINLLTDKWLSMSHRSMENCLLIAANATSFNEQEKDKIIKVTVCNYLKKRRQTASYVKKVTLHSEELSDDEMMDKVEAAALTTNNPLRVEDDDADLKEDDMPDDLSASENSDIDDDCSN